jgi:hypothetical protein
LLCCLDPLQLLAQLAWGSKRLRSVPATTVARTAEAPAVDRSTPVMHLLGELIPKEQDALHWRAAAGPRIVSVDHNGDKSQQSTTINPRTQGEIR